MEIIPLIYFKERKIYIEKNSEPLSIKDFLLRYEKLKKIYLFDIDGIEKDKPNLCTYQRFSGLYEIWVDNGPRNIGDIVDSTTAGATDITIRPKIFANLKVSDIKEITENKIYSIYETNSLLNKPAQTDGLVNFYSIKELDSDLKSKSNLLEMISKSNSYSYITNIAEESYWKRIGANGLIIDLKRYEELKND